MQNFNLQLAEIIMTNVIVSVSSPNFIRMLILPKLAILSEVNYKKFPEGSSRDFVMIRQWSASTRANWVWTSC